MKKLLLITVLVTNMTSCKKDPVKGCTNATATNYNSTATQDNGTCQFKGSMIVWTKPVCSNVSLYIDGSYKGTLTGTLNAKPQNCDATGAYKIELTWSGTSSSRTYNFSATNNTTAACPTTHQWQQSITIDAGKCGYLELQ
jgi:hypothetical protein